MVKKIGFACIALIISTSNVWGDLPSKEKLKGLRNALELRLYNKQLKNGGGKCLGIVGDEVKIFDCSDDPSQRWFFRDGKIKNINQKCLEVAAPDLQKNGGRVQVGDSNDSPNQKWRVDSGRLVNDGGKCLDVAGPDLHKNGGHVQIWDCNTAPNQQWQEVEIKK